MKRWVFALFVVLLIWLPSIQSSQPFVDNDMLKRIRKDYSEQAYLRGITLNNLINELQDREIPKQLMEVNRFFNQFQYREDIEHWGVKDYWATPEEFLGTQQGDCEDFVISKYFTLRELGVPDDRLYLTYVKELNRNIAHMVLSYFEKPSSIPLILDNYNPAILPANQRKDLLPVYSFNAQSLFLNNASAGLGKSLPTDKIKNSKWQKLLADLKKVKR